MMGAQAVLFAHHNHLILQFSFLYVIIVNIAHFRLSLDCNTLCLVLIFLLLY